MPTAATIHILMLSRIEGLGPSSLNTLLSTLRSRRYSIQRFLLLDPFVRRREFPLPTTTHTALDHWPELLDETERLHRELATRGILALPITHKTYPHKLRLRLGRSAPPVLFVKGNCSILKTPTIAIVGTRIPSDRGVSVITRYAAALASAGLTILSGNARGIDAAAHHGALTAGGRTAFVIPSGILRFSPRASCGPLVTPHNSLILSQFSPHGEFSPAFAARRNSTIAALADALFVGETPLRSGTAYAIRHALSFRIPLFTLVYQAPPPSAQGNQSLLASGAIPLKPLLRITPEVVQHIVTICRTSHQSSAARRVSLDSPSRQQPELFA
jgi:DNA processing protein